MSDGIKITKLQFNPSELERSLDAIQNKVNSKIETVSGEVGKDILDLAKENNVPVDLFWLDAGWYGDDIDRPESLYEFDWW